MKRIRACLRAAVWELGPWGVFVMCLVLGLSLSAIFLSITIFLRVVAP